ncbi:hypothetical protein SOM61_11055 [Massilia sp. CFBP9012]|uniref:hypothetical protein n=1 Tax=Massilia sp. CFBP9012 TaxID=3096531 RepID=UPI002A6AD489|nr:hypothetical protein [Massilia sp. CFBP9012]MDY0975507.1 hypothetical protein [Massilia sp. CFBP9012]
MKALPLAILLLASGSALANDAALLKCRAVTDVAARVACYDAIPLGAASPAAAAPGAPRAAAPVATAEENFGMEAVKQRETQPKSMQSTIVGNFEGWGPGSRIRLANGQVWRVVDGSDAVLAPAKDVKVSIERNMFGTIFMRVDGTNASAKVRRVE